MREGGSLRDGTDVWGLFAVVLGTPWKKLQLGPHLIAEENTQWSGIAPESNLPCVLKFRFICLILWI